MDGAPRPSNAGWPARRVQPVLGRVPTWSWLAALTVALVALALPLRTAAPPTGDSPQNLTIAWNISQHGVYSSEIAGHGVASAPDHRREPTYPALLAMAMAVAAPDGADVGCLLSAEPGCAAALPRLALVNVALLLGVAWSAAWAAHLVIGRRWAVLAAFALAGFSTTFLSDVDQFVNELVAAPLVVLVSAGSYHVAARARPGRPAAATGVALGALMLTKALWFYLAVPVLVAAALLWWRRRLAAPALAGLGVVVLVAYAVAAPWVVRNAVVAGSVAPAGGDAQILALRAEKATMTWPEYAAAYLVYTPVVGLPLLERVVDDEHWRRVPRANEDSYFRRARGLAAGGEVPARAGDLRDPAAVRQASLEIIADRPVMSAALTPLFAWRSAFVEVGMTSLAAQGTPVAVTLSGTLAPVTALWGLALIPVLLIAAWRALRIRHGPWLAFLLPLLGSYFAHAVVTHAVPRYTHPLIPALVVAGLALLAGELPSRRAQPFVR